MLEAIVGEELNEHEHCVHLYDPEVSCHKLTEGQEGYEHALVRGPCFRSICMGKSMRDSGE